MRPMHAKTAIGRARIAARLLKTRQDLSCCRDFDDCFEMGDGGAVKAHLIALASQDVVLLRAMYHHDSSIQEAWANQALALSRYASKADVYAIAEQTERIGGEL